MRRAPRIRACVIRSGRGPPGRPPRTGPPQPPSRDRTVRSWPLLVLAVPAAAEVWSGWVGIAQKTGFGLVSPLPGIWPSLHLDTAITLPVGVEAYAAYALRAWLAHDREISAGTRRFARWSAICSFALGMAGQVAYHLMAQARMARAPWAITTVVSCLPVLVLAMGTALAHMLRADAEAAYAPGSRTRPPAFPRSLSWSPQEKAGAGRTGPGAGRDRSASRDQAGPAPGPQHGGRTTMLDPPPARGQAEQARMVARRLAAAGRPVSRRALRSRGITGSNAALNALARMVNAERASAAPTAAALWPGGDSSRSVSPADAGWRASARQETPLAPGADGGTPIARADQACRSSPIPARRP